MSSTGVVDPSATSLPSLVRHESTSHPTATQSIASESSLQAEVPEDTVSAPAEAPAASTSSTPADPPISKSALKRLRKQEAFQAQKLQRRAHEKEKRKAKAAEVKRLVAEGKMDKPVNKKRRPNGRQEPHGARIAIDMGFDELMSEKEAKSMASQLGYCYSANRSASHPFPLLVTSFNGRLREAYEKRGDYVSWKGVEWWEEGIEHLYEGVDETPSASVSTAEGASTEPIVASTSAASTAEPPSDAPVPAEKGETTSPGPLVTIGTYAGRPRSRAPRSTVVYLTGDSPNVLTTLAPGHTYILGGIVDRNRYKNLCLDKANRLGIQHAQLPIGEFLPELQTRKVLTVNQVYEILVGWVEEGGREDGWREALRRVMPERKFHSESRKDRRAGHRQDGEGGADGESQGAEGVYIARDDSDEEEEEEEEAQGEEAEMIIEPVHGAQSIVPNQQAPNETTGDAGSHVDEQAEQA